MPQDVDPALLAALVQDLEGMRRAGLKSVPHIDPALLAPASPRPASAATAPTVRGSANAPLRPASAAGAGAPRGQLLPSAQDSTVPRRNAAKAADRPAVFSSSSTAPSPAGSEGPPLSPPSGATLSREQREEQLQIARCKVAACIRCKELADTRTQTVFGVGNPMTKVVFIGEAPGADEDKQGEPFVGKAGQLLNKIIEAAKLRREDIYIANVLKCRPPGNRTPSPAEAENCWEYLTAQLTILDPDYIVCWGSVAAQTLLKTTTAIGKMRGRFLSYGRAKVLCTYHPSYLLRNPAAKKDVWDDMKFWRADMGVTL